MADFTDLKREVLADWRAQSKWRDQAKDDYAFVAGHQWTDEEIAQMEDKARAPIVFNRVAVIMSAVAGSEINNRTEVRFIPREIGDAEPNEVLTAGAEWFRDQSHAEDEESEAFSDLLTCGLGWTETTLNFETDEEGDPEVLRIDPLEMCHDRHARRKGLSDSRRFARVRSIPTAEAKDRFPGKSVEEIHAAWINRRDPASGETNPDDDYDHNEEFDEEQDTVTVVQLQYSEKVRVVEYMMDGQKQEMPEKNWNVISKQLPVKPPHRRKAKWVWKQVFLGNGGVLDENQPDPNAATFHAITGKWDVKEKCWYGLLRSMRDPQKFANKWVSQTLHIINSNAKGGIMMEPGAVDDPRAFEESWAATDAVTWVRDGALRSGAITEKPKVQMPAALMSLTEFAISSIRDASGVNMELLGLRDANQPGVLEYQRRQSAMTTLAGFFDSMRFYRKRQGESILHFLRAHIAPTGRLVRLVREGQAQYVPLAMDEGTRKYDVIVDDAPQAPNEKEKTWSVIEAMLPMLQGAGLGWAEWADLLEYSPLPASLVEKVRKKAEAEKDPQAEQMQQQMQQLALRGQAAEVRKLESEAVENEAEAMYDEARAQQVMSATQLEPIRTLADIQRQAQQPEGRV